MSRIVQHQSHLAIAVIKCSAADMVSVVGEKARFALNAPEILYFADIVADYLIGLDMTMSGP